MINNETAAPSVRKIVSLYTEATPNPETMKFVANYMLFPQNSIDFPSRDSHLEASPLAKELFGLPFVKGVFIANNFVTVTKEAGNDWFELIPVVKELLKNFIAADHAAVLPDKIVSAATNSAVRTAYDNEAAQGDSETVVRIKELLKKYVQPAVEMDGGAIIFRKFENGILTLGMQGACSGCPSSSVTLKAGIEGLMRRMLPEVQEVVAEAL